MDIPAGGDQATDAPWGINPATGKPWTKSPEERAAIGARLAEARSRKAADRQAAAVEEFFGVTDPAPIDRSAPDREPGTRPEGRSGRRRIGRGRRRAAAPPADVPPFKAGPIAKGMNRLYAKAGRLVKLANPMLGEAIVSITRKESDDDETVGEAWEALAQVSPVWRGRLLKICTGGAGGRVLLAHMPILLAVMMLEPVKKKMPFGNVVEAVFGDDDPPATSGPTDVGAMPDVEQMMAMATQMMGPLMMQRAATAAAPRTPPANGWPAGENPDGTYGPATAAAA